MARRVMRGVLHLVQEISELLQFCVMEVVYNLFVLGVVIESTEGALEFSRRLGNLVQAPELAGNRCPVGDFLAGIHGGMVWGVLNEAQPPTPSVILRQNDRNSSQPVAYAGKWTQVTFAAVRVFSLFRSSRERG